MFVLGYFRSGTTFLQNLLAADPDLRSPSWPQVLAPQAFVPGWFFLRYFFVPLLPLTRLGAVVPVGARLPGGGRLRVEQSGRDVRPRRTRHPSPPASLLQSVSRSRRAFEEGVEPLALTSVRLRPEAYALLPAGGDFCSSRRAIRRASATSRICFRAPSLSTSPVRRKSCSGPTSFWRANCNVRSPCSRRCPRTSRRRSSLTNISRRRCTIWRIELDSGRRPRGSAAAGSHCRPRGRDEADLP